MRAVVSSVSAGLVSPAGAFRTIGRTPTAVVILAMTMRYAHLAPEHLRSEVVKTERPLLPAQPAESSTQEVSERVELLEVSRKSLS